MYALLLRLMFLVSPERIHHLAFAAMRFAAWFPPLRWAMTKLLTTDDPVLRGTAFGVEFPGRSAWPPVSTRMPTASTHGPRSGSVSPRSALSPRRPSRAIPRRGCSGCPPTMP